MIQNRKDATGDSTGGGAREYLQTIQYPDVRKTAAYTLLIFTVFLAYYFIASSTLPIGAGPDYRASNDVVRFIYKNRRLATIPKDEGELHYSVYGGTRALRPPLSYIVAAGAATLLESLVENRHVLFRKGSGLLAAGAVAISFYTATIYFHSYLAGLMVALLLGLLPQFVFIASYNNDDSGAIFSATLMICALTRILRKGVGWANILFLSFASGLVVLSKQTAWLLAPTILMFLAVYLRTSWSTLMRYVSAGLVVFLLAGGWWLVFNIYNYGLDDPLLLNVQVEVAERHSGFDAGTLLGYGPRGIGYKELIIENHDQFWQKTIASTIGNLDWLRIRLGPWQYALYIAVFVVAGVYPIVRVISVFWNKWRAVDYYKVDRDIYFEALLALALLFQLWMYVWVNVNNDIQLQGKYLLTVFLGVAILAVGAVRAGIRKTAPTLMGHAPDDVCVNRSLVQGGGTGLAVAVLVWIHLDGLLNYVVPYYRPVVHGISLEQESREISIPGDWIQRKNQIDEFITTDSGFAIDSNGVDPWFVIGLDGKTPCEMFHGHNILTAKVRSEEASVFQLYVDKGFGFRERDSYWIRYPDGESSIMLVFDVPQCLRLRFDPTARPIQVEVDNLSLGKIAISDGVH